MLLKIEDRVFHHVGGLSGYMVAGLTGPSSSCTAETMKCVMHYNATASCYMSPIGFACSQFHAYNGTKRSGATSPLVKAVLPCMQYAKADYATMNYEPIPWRQQANCWVAECPQYESDVAGVYTSVSQAARNLSGYRHTISNIGDRGRFSSLTSVEVQ